VHQQTIEEIVGEIGSQVTGRFMGRIFQLSPLSLAIDLGSREAGYLFLSAEPSAPRIYLIKRRFRELERQSIAPLPFVQAMRRCLGGGTLLSASKEPSERVVRLVFSVQDEVGQTNIRTLLVQLTGRSANLFLLDQDGYITHAIRPPRGVGQQIGDRYECPPAQTETAQREEPLRKGNFGTLSEAADDCYLKREAAESFTARTEALRGKLRKELAQNTKLQSNLRRDLAAHGDPEQHKRCGDLLLANIANARRVGNKVTVKDYYSEGTPDIEIEIDENISLQDQAAHYFSRYAKAKRATSEIATRLAQIGATVSRLEERKMELESIIASRDEVALARFGGPAGAGAVKRSVKKPAEKIPGVRRYRSSDGFEILVGRAAHTNDHLTFRVARPHDWWLHAADYPGSHVIVRNPTRGEIPQRTIIEAAQIAARFSQAGNDSKVAVHYTQRKFLSKPKGVAPGLVRMSSFRTAVVQPGENVPRLIEQD
jgi:predicted ribosome quality control (RQC) complex YloA/Tae2 family protein